MKKTAVSFALSILLFSACNVSQKVTGDTDDVYAVPSEEKAKAKAVAEEQARQDAIARQKEEEQRKADAQNTYTSSASQDLNGTNPSNASNPYYHDPQYSADDYYDYAYASRINRFSHPMGLGYYDGYYTNMYTYNQIPANYGVSIYSNYIYGMPGSYSSWGIGFGNSWGSCYPYSSYYYDPWYNSGWYGSCGYGYSYGYPYSYGYGGWGYRYNNWSYMNGYYNGYYNGYSNGLFNSGWTYLNGSDPNSGYGHVVNAPRGSNGGDNSRMRSGSDQVRDAGSSRYLQEVADQQNRRQRFMSSDERPVRREQPVSNTRREQPYINGAPQNQSSQPAGGYHSGNGRDRGDVIRPGRQQSNDRIQRRDNNYQAPSRREPPVMNQGGLDNGGGRSRSGGGGTSPRNSGGNSPRR